MVLRRLILSLFIRKDSSDETNYRPICILRVLSKAFERCLYDHIYGIQKMKLLLKLKIKSSSSKTLFGVLIDNKLNLNEHISKFRLGFQNI